MAVRLFKDAARATAPDGKFSQVLGLDDATRVGAPRNMILGAVQDLQEPNAVMIDLAGYKLFFPNEPLQVGKTFEMHDRRAKIVTSPMPRPLCHVSRHVHPPQPGGQLCRPGAQSAVLCAGEAAARRAAGRTKRPDRVRKRLASGG